MKIYISADIEGVSGIVTGEMCSEGHPEFGRSRRLLTKEVNAAVAGALAGGATEVLVNDAHGGKKNILIEELHPGARLLTGDPKPLSMMAGIDASFAGVMLVGYHSRSASRGVLNHTVNGRCVRKLVVNGREVGEAAMNAGLAGYFGVPVIMASGDDCLAAEVRDFFGDIEVAEVKIAVGRTAANCLPPVKAQELIEAAAKRAVQRVKSFKAYDPGKPVTYEITWHLSAFADTACHLPGVERIDDTTVRFTHEDHLEAFKCFRSMVALT